MTAFAGYDPKTLGAALLVVALVSAFTLLVVRFWRVEYEGPTWWAAGILLLYWSYFASSLDPGPFAKSQPPFANTAYVAAFFSISHGFREFFGLRFRWGPYGALTALWIAAVVHHATAGEGAAVQAGAAALIATAISLDSMTAILRRARPGLRLAYGAAAAAFPFALVAVYARLAEELVGSEFLDGLGEAEIAALDVFATIAATLGFAFGAIMMISARMHRGLRIYAERFQFEALHDALTGVGNRRMFMDVATCLLALRRRHTRPFALISFDLDLFKRINDAHGHAVGDEVLRAVGKAVRSLLRGEDVFARIGGEEFVVLMPEAGLHQATVAAERLRAGIEALAIPTKAGPIRITCSFGVAEGDPSDPDPESLMERADAALYEAKKGGRNRVVAPITPASFAGDQR